MYEIENGPCLTPRMSMFCFGSSSRLFRAIQAPEQSNSARGSERRSTLRAVAASLSALPASALPLPLPRATLPPVDPPLLPRRPSRSSPFHSDAAAGGATEGCACVGTADLSDAMTAGTPCMSERVAVARRHERMAMIVALLIDSSYFYCIEVFVRSDGAMCLNG